MAGTREQHAAGDPRLDPSRTCRSCAKEKQQETSPAAPLRAEVLMLKLQPWYLQPVRATESAHSIPGFIPAASCHRQTCTAVHKQMSFDNSEKKRSGVGWG